MVPSMTRRLLPVAAVVVSAAASVLAQTAALPEGWRVRVDGVAPGQATQDAAASLKFVDMPPGWHITTGPAVVLYHPDRRATGTYSVRSESYLFDPGTRREAYGLVIGGANLDTAEQRYTYFLIRRTGEFTIRRRAGERVTTVREWTPHDAIVQYDKRGDARTAKNVLGVDVEGDVAVFRVNDAEVARVPRAEIDTDGVVGLRVNHHLNLHVSTLEVTPAP